MTGGTDIHSHLIPGVDDGAPDEATARAALREMEAAGVRTIVTTPHVNGSLSLDPPALEGRLAELDAGWAVLDRVVRAEFPGLTVGRGAEVALDVPGARMDDPRLRLDGGPAVLVEFPWLTVPPRSVEALSALRMQGWRPVLAHPERYRGLDRALALAGEWRRVGAALQVNAGSLTGRYGPVPRELALGLLARGWADCLSSDYHARAGTGLVSAREWLEERGAGGAAALLLEENAARIVAGEDPLPVPPVGGRKRGLLGRLTSAFR